MEGTHKIKLSDVNDLLSKNIDEKLVGFDSDMESFYEKLQAGASELKSNLKALEVAAPADTYDVITLNRANYARRELINKLSNLIGELKKATEFDFYAMINFHNSCMTALEEMNKIKTKYYKLLDAYFPEEMKNLELSFKSLSSMLETSGNILKSKEELINPIEEVKEVYEGLNSEFNRMNEHKKEKIVMEERLQKLKSEHKMLAKELEKIVNGESLRKFNEAVSRRDLINNEVKEIESNIILLISSFDRPLRKFKKLVDVGSEHTEFKKELGLYINSPLDAVESDREQKIFISLLNGVKKCINENKIEIKLPEKILAKISDIVNDKSLAKMKKKLDATISEMNDLNEYIAGETIQDRKLSLEDNISRMGNEIKELEKEHEFLAKKLDKISDDISTKHLSLKEMLEKIVDRKVELESY